MVTLQEQINRSLLRPGPARVGSPSRMGPLFQGPRVPEADAGCSWGEVAGAMTYMCPTQWPIIKKTKTPGPPYPMSTFGDRAYAIAAFWSTGTALFMQTPDRMIIAMRKDGTVKLYRPRKHIVVSSNPRVKNLVRARDRIDNLSKRLRGAIGAKALTSGRGKKR